MCGYGAADLCLCFRKCNKQVSSCHDLAHMIEHVKASAIF